MLDKATNAPQAQSLVKLYEMGGKMIPTITSLQIAEQFSTGHREILRAIRDEIEEGSRKDGWDFAQIFYKDSYGRKQPMYILSEDLALFIVLGFSGEKAKSIKRELVSQFRKIKEELDKNKDPVLEFFRPHILEMPSEWTKRFYDDFYKGIYKIYKIKQKGNNHPGFFGWFTNHYVYNVLCKSNGKLLHLLKEKNPVVEGDGNLAHRKSKHHQYLDAIGIVNLQAHVSKVTALLQAAINKRDFEDMFSRVFHTNDVMLECFPVTQENNRYFL